MKRLQRMALAAGAMVSLFAGLQSCTKDIRQDTPYKYETDALKLPETPFNYSNPTLPNHFASTRQLVQQQVTDQGATLGRVLFYDTKLSLNNKISCASCHDQTKGFADPVQFSTGFDGGKTGRNASSIVNPVSSRAFFWDARESNLKSMVLRPIENHIEMGMDNFDALEKKLGNLDYYKPLFKNAFGDDKVTRERIAEAMSQFLKSMVTANTTFDSSNPGGWGSGNSLVFSDSEQRGMSIFFNEGRCANCHNPAQDFAFFMQEDFADIGLDAQPADKGLGANQEGMDGMFKIPSLRNIALTAPYMHDGRFKTLEEVVNHYSDNIQPSANLNWSLLGADGQPLRMNLSADQKADLIAFLHTLTDHEFTKDEKFSNPFND